MLTNTLLRKRLVTPKFGVTRFVTPKFVTQSPSFDRSLLRIGLRLQILTNALHLIAPKLLILANALFRVAVKL